MAITLAESNAPQKHPISERGGWECTPFAGGGSYLYIGAEIRLSPLTPRHAVRYYRGKFQCISRAPLRWSLGHPLLLEGIMLTEEQKPTPPTSEKGEAPLEGTAVGFRGEASPLRRVLLSYAARQLFAEASRARTLQEAQGGR